MQDAANADSVASRALVRLRGAAPELAPALLDSVVVQRLACVAMASDFAIDTLTRQPALLARLLADDGAVSAAPPALHADNRSDWPMLLRRHRAAESTRLVWRDVLGIDEVAATLAGSTELAEDCLQVALAALEREFAQRHGVIREPVPLSDPAQRTDPITDPIAGAPQRLVVFGLGKLGGGELNFSSDVDLVYGFECDGQWSSDGARPLDAETYFTRLGQQLAKLLDEVTADGFCHRVDLRLRPYGNAGRVAWSFAAMEQYFQHEGRDWERYAWQKARPVAGDVQAGERFLETLRPFIYRRYLDFGALDGLRTMKAAIAAEVARKELADDIKRGPGGIREIEFLVQALQLIRGGREPSLRGRRLLPALEALVAAGHVAGPVAAALAQAYRFLRRLENRLQMLRDAQTHSLPARDDDRQRLAEGLGVDDWAGVCAALDVQRALVTAEFEALLAPRRAAAAPDALADYWRSLRDVDSGPVGGPDALAAAGFAEPGNADAMLRDLARSPGVRSLSDSTRARLDRVLPALLLASAASTQPMLALRRALALLHNVLRRSAYLALLDEQPEALARLVEVVSRSALLAERLVAYPLLLDELLDARVAGPLPDRAQLREACVAATDRAATESRGDVEATLQALNEVRQALSFRIAMAVRDSRQPAAVSARQLAWLADAVVERVLVLAEQEVARTHGRVPGARFAVIGYGSLGGQELGFGSDLDLVFLYDTAGVEPAAGAHDAGQARPCRQPGDPDQGDVHATQTEGAVASGHVVAPTGQAVAPDDAARSDTPLQSSPLQSSLLQSSASSDGARPLDAARWFARLAQKVVALLGTTTAAGRLFDIDVRLRPDGAKGLLVSTLASHAEYQRDRAWTWEHQALVRARCVAGDVGLCADYERVRAQTLARARSGDKVRSDVLAMRARMRGELDRSDPTESGVPGTHFDLKQGEAGLVDLEFLLQALVLAHAAAQPPLLAPRDTPGLIDALGQAGVLDATTASGLHAAHATLLERGLLCTLDRRRRLVPLDGVVQRARESIREAARAQGLVFAR